MMRSILCLAVIDPLRTRVILPRESRPEAAYPGPAVQGSGGSSWLAGKEGKKRSGFSDQHNSQDGPLLFPLGKERVHRWFDHRTRRQRQKQFQ